MLRSDNLLMNNFRGTNVWKLILNSIQSGSIKDHRDLFNIIYVDKSVSKMGRTPKTSKMFIFKNCTSNCTQMYCKTEMFLISQRNEPVYYTEIILKG